MNTLLSDNEIREIVAALADSLNYHSTIPRYELLIKLVESNAGIMTSYWNDNLWAFKKDLTLEKLEWFKATGEHYAD